MSVDRTRPLRKIYDTTFKKRLEKLKGLYDKCTKDYIKTTQMLTKIESIMTKIDKELKGRFGEK